MFWELLENAVEISSAPSEAIPLFVPNYSWYEHDVDSIEALRPQKLRLGLGNIEASRRKLLPKVLDLGKKEINISFLYNRDQNPLVAIQRLPDQLASVDLAVLANIAGDTSRANILVKMHDLVHDFHALLFNVSN
jgi:hypothetical protein